MKTHILTVKAILVLAFCSFIFINAQNTFPATGGVGIGTDNPAYQLDVLGGTSRFKDFVNGDINSNAWIFHSPQDNRRSLYIAPIDANRNWDWGKSVIINNNGNMIVQGQLDIIHPLGRTIIGDNASTSHLRMISGNYATMLRNDGSLTFLLLTNSGDQYGGWNSLRPLIVNNANGYLHLATDTPGKVSIGTLSTPTSIGGANIGQYKLFVKGGILADEVRVRTGWADYVFADEYSLKPLAEVESFIKKNKHLPNVPTSKEVESQGINVGNIAKIQQEKIEELTLYIIDQNKRIEKLESQIEKLVTKK